MTHLLVTNDFPPKVGGIQSYLHELWRRLPADRFAVLTIDHEGAADFDAAQAFRIDRVDEKMLLPTARIRRLIDATARSVGARLVVLDPALPIGLVGRHLELPYALVLHGAEVTVPGRLPVTRTLLRRAIAGAELLIAAGGYPAAEARAVAGRSTPPVALIPPGVDVKRFHPLTEAARAAARAELSIASDALCVVSVSRLVPRKGMDVLIEAASVLCGRYPELTVLIGGEGRDLGRLRRLADARRAPVRFLGRVADSALPELYGAADVVAVCCRNRWLGLEQEGFGIVFLEAAASGVAALAGRSGGADEAVLDGATGIVADRPGDLAVVTSCLETLLKDTALRERYGRAGRERAVGDFDYDVLARRLDDALVAAENR